MNSPAPAPASVSGFAFTPAVFLALSSGLTGVSAAGLHSSDSTDFTQRFHSAILSDLSPDRLERLANIFLSSQTVTEGAAEVLVDPDLSSVGRNIIRLWLTGLWYHPTDRARPPRIVGGEEYRQSPVWRVLRSHGANDHRFNATGGHRGASA
jgi:hypothetical protein